MKVLFLHISDLHIKNNKGCNEFQLKKITDALRAFTSVDKVFIIISGDIAASGKCNEYNSAFLCIGQIITNLKKSGFRGVVEVLCVPGNHDMDYSLGEISSDDLQAMYKSNSYEASLDIETDKLKNFYNFARRNHCFSKEKVYCRRIIDLGGFKIEANLINSGIFSIRGEDKGLHYIPQYCLNEYRKPTNADFVITIMHHAPDFYIDRIKNELEAAIYTKSSIVFFGHEHYIGQKILSYETASPVLIQAGGVLCENDNWQKSTFYAGILDTTTLKYEQHKYIWNGQQRLYEQGDQNEIELQNKPSIEKRLVPISAYSKGLLEDKKHKIAQSFQDYFVFPRLQREDINDRSIREILGEDDFAEEILAKKRVVINGSYSSGKTTLLKELFLHFSDSHCVILCDMEDIRGKKADRIIKNCFEDIYGDNPSDYQRFLQMPKSQRMIFIDDIDQIKRESLDAFLEQLDEWFEYSVFASNQVLDLSLTDRMKVLLKTSDSICTYKLMPYFADKREELIRKVVNIKVKDKEMIDKTVALLTDSVNVQRRFISLDPDFLIKYIEYYCNNLGDAGTVNSDVFSKVFEANLTYALQPYRTDKLTVDKLFTLLAKIARYIHFNKAYPISEEEVIKVITDYNAVYGAKVNYREAINAMCNSNILKSADGKGYRFANRSYLAYFVAKEVNSAYNESGDNNDLQRLLKNACFGINSDILLFISYITDNVKVLRLFLSLTEELTRSWEEFDFGNNLPDYLSKNCMHDVLPPNINEKKLEKDAAIDAERKASNELQTQDIYDYSDEDAEKLINQIVRAISLLSVASKCLPNFEHNMTKPIKDAFVSVIYRLPNKIFNLWATEMNRDIADIIQFFKDQDQNYYSRQKPMNDDDILRALQWASISLLLDLYNLPMFYAAKENTKEYLSEFNHQESLTYRLEYLMMLEKVGEGQQFTQQALKLEEDMCVETGNLSLRRLVRHALVFMPELDYKLSQQLTDKFFPQTSAQKRILADKMATSRPKGE